MYQGWKMGAFIALYAYVGCKKIQHFQKSDFKALYDDEKQHNKEWHKAGAPRWESVRHYVIIPNYKEELDDLRMTLDSVSASIIAKEQISIVLAMEAREEGAQERV